MKTIEQIIAGAKIDMHEGAISLHHVEMAQFVALRNLIVEDFVSEMKWKHSFIHIDGNQYVNAENLVAVASDMQMLPEMFEEN